MQDQVVQVEFLDTFSHEHHNFTRTGELIDPFTIDELGVNVEGDVFTVAAQRSSGDTEVFFVPANQVERFIPLVKHNGQWVVA